MLFLTIVIELLLWEARITIAYDVFLSKLRTVLMKFPHYTVLYKPHNTEETVSTEVCGFMMLHPGCINMLLLKIFRIILTQLS